MKKTKFLREEFLNSPRGITLIALVITIIVLLILAGVSISLIAGGDGILKKATDAVDTNTIATAKEGMELKIAEVLIDYYEDVYVNKTYSVNTTKLDYILEKSSSGITTGGFSYTISENGTITIAQNNKLEAGITGKISEDGVVTWSNKVEIPEGLAVGATVTYTPSGIYSEWTTDHSGYSTAYSLASGKSYTDSSTQTDMTITSWKVFNIDETTGEVELVPSSPTSNTVELVGADGYNNAVKLLNDACSSLYSNTAKGITARSINIEDIESVLDYDPTTYSNSNATYGEKKEGAYESNKQYPAIYAEEVNSVIDEVENTSSTALGLSDSASDWISESVDTARSIRPYQTYYYLSNSNFSSNLDEGYSGILLPSGNNTQYWVASRCVNLGSILCNFLVRNVRSGGLHANLMYDSSGDTSDCARSLFPVVSLSSEVIEGSAETGWSVK